MRRLLSSAAKRSWTLAEIVAELRPLFLSPVRREEDDQTRALYAQVRRLCARHPFRTEEAWAQFVVGIIADVCMERDVTPTVPLGNALWGAIAEFATAEGFAQFPTGRTPPPNLTMEEGLRLREQLRRTQRFLADHERLIPLWRQKLVYLFAGMLQYFPPSAFTDIDERGQALDDSVVFPKAKALDLCENLPQVLDRALVTFNDEDIRDAHLFDGVRDRLDLNLCLASGLSPGKTGKVSLPSEHKNQSPEYLIQAYAGGTPLEAFFNSSLPFAIPFPARFEHTHIVGGTGHGKTQLIQFLVNHDLVRSQEDGRSVVIIDSQGDLIRTMSRLRYFDPEAERSLADRFVLIDPTDIEHPVALNMFDFNRSRLSGYAPLDREKILNATIELYDYFFGALLGAELTQRQGLIFKYLARLMIEIPGATIHTLRELMEDGEKFLPHMEKLTGTARAFFATRFFEKQFNETKKQILARLWGVLSNSSLERMFAHKTSKIDFFELLNSGKIIFINTAKDLLGQEGAAIFGRFFIALLGQAAVQRAAIPSHARRPCFAYIDEAQDYFDANISNLLSQARKYKVSITIAHQTIAQFSPELRGSVFASTTIKFAGGVSAQDAKPVADELRCDSDFLLAQKRGKTHTHFACSVKNFTGRALSVAIPLGYVESLPTISREDEAHLREINRETYCAPPEIVADMPFAIGKKAETRTKKERKEEETQQEPVSRAPVEKEAIPRTIELEPPPAVSAPAPLVARPEPRVPPMPGRGGKDHKRVQHFVKELGEHRGFRAVIEDAVLDGKGQIDVSLVRGDLRIACEISITTGKDQELGNVEKCIAAGYKHILLVGKTERQAKQRAAFITKSLEEGHGATIHAIAEDGIDEYLQSFGDVVQTTEKVVRGIKVKTKTVAAPIGDAAERRKTLVDVVARMKRPEEE